MSKVVPEILKNHILPFDWDVHKIWEIQAPVFQISCAEFEYLLELSLWSSVPNQGLLFDVRPIDVIRDPGRSPYQARRLARCDLQHPIDILLAREKRWVLDGVHRIAKQVSLQRSTIAVRFHDESVIPIITRG
ncbi:MAG: hypothetical protein FIA97_06300 [Methylococcaceae bacterium]|nr:hypothetical protein [Methylococcaceae bacterium]